MQEIITKTDLCKLLDITPRVAQRELEKALLIENSGVFKFGKSYRCLRRRAETCRAWRVSQEAPAASRRAPRSGVLAAFWQRRSLADTGTGRVWDRAETEDARVSVSWTA